MTNTKTKDVEHENVIQESAGNQVKDDAQETQKTEGPIPSSSISSDYAAKYFNFDNIPPVDTEVVSMLDINVQHEVPRTSPLLTIPISVIPEHNVINIPETITTTSATTISSLLIVDLEKDVKELKDVDGDKSQKVVQNNVLTSLKNTCLVEPIRENSSSNMHRQKRVGDIREIKYGACIGKKQLPIKSFNKSPKQRALYDALMESILEDEDVVDEGVAEKLKKRKPDDADKDEGPFARLNRGLKRQKIIKDIEPSKKAKSTETSKGTSKSQPKSTGNFA
ncbi:hypothetical protein Tco_0662977 [Tanacetum coccineum]